MNFVNLSARRQAHQRRFIPFHRCTAPPSSIALRMSLPLTSTLRTSRPYSSVKLGLTVTLPLLYQADTELLEYICNENNRYFEIVPKK